MALIGVQVIRLRRTRAGAPSTQPSTDLDADDFQPMSKTVPRNYNGKNYALELSVYDVVSKESIRAVYGEGLIPMVMPEAEYDFLREALKRIVRCTNHEEEGHAPSGIDCPEGFPGIPTFSWDDTLSVLGTSELRIGLGIRVGSYIAYRPADAKTKIDFRIGKVLFIYATPQEHNVIRISVHTHKQLAPTHYLPLIKVEPPSERIDHRLHVTSLDEEEVDVKDIICILDTDGVIGSLRKHPAENIHYSTG